MRGDDVCPQRFVTSKSEHLQLGVNSYLQSRNDVCPQRFVTSKSEHLPLGVNSYLQSGDDVCPQRFVTSEREHLQLGVNSYLQSRDDVCPQRFVTSEREHLPLGVNSYLQSGDDVCPQRFVTSEREHLQLGTGRRHPPVLRNHPPVSGAIFWERSLFNRLKRSVLIFQKVEELKDSALKTECNLVQCSAVESDGIIDHSNAAVSVGIQQFLIVCYEHSGISVVASEQARQAMLAFDCRYAFAAYLKIAKAMKSFEDSKYDQWITRSVPIVQTTLNKNVLKMIHYDRERGGTCSPWRRPFLLRRVSITNEGGKVQHETLLKTT
uniref:(California timema) hypothetical protein n=1 Tax=Timema californicum TaxID=61474 RepID=A0A7R9PC80_TIMCA|nr:unnamed protein product [Timema californicum]